MGLITVFNQSLLSLLSAPFSKNHHLPHNHRGNTRTHTNCRGLQPSGRRMHPSDAVIKGYNPCTGLDKQHRISRQRWRQPMQLNTDDQTLLWSEKTNRCSLTRKRLRNKKAGGDSHLQKTAVMKQLRGGSSCSHSVEGLSKKA